MAKRRIRKKKPMFSLSKSAKKTIDGFFKPFETFVKSKKFKKGY